MFKSLRARLVAGYALVLLASMVIISLYLYAQVRYDLVQTMKLFLKSELLAAVELIEGEAADPSLMANFLSRQTLLGRGPHRLSYALFDGEQHVIARTEGFSEDLVSVRLLDASNLKSASGSEAKNQPPASGAGYFGFWRLFSAFSKFVARLLPGAFAPQDEYSTTEQSGIYERTLERDSGRRIHLATRSFRHESGGLFYLQFGLDESGIAGNIRALGGAIFVAVPAILLLAILGGIYLTRRLLSPIGKISEAARQLSLTDLHKELPRSGSGDELDELAAAFNDVFKRLREAYQRVIRFTADASHELRLPVTAIKGEAEIVLSREHSLEEYRKVLADIIEEFDRLTHMVQQLLTLARSDSGEDVFEKNSIDLCELLRRLIEFYHPLAEEKELALELNKENYSGGNSGQSPGFPEQYPPTGQTTGGWRRREAEPSLGVQIQGDSGKLQELFSNLLENAIKYTPSGGRITVDVAAGASSAYVTISDTGIGIPRSEHAKIFERFYRVDKSRSRDQGGAGLGLSIADAIARAHHGSITVESEPGQGSRFIVTLPKTS